MTLHLYVGSKRLSSWSLRPYLALAHTGAPFETTTILLDQSSTKSEIEKVSPAGKVPVLHHDGNIIWDSLSICEYVAELFPDAKLWPTDRAQRAKARSISCEMHSSFGGLRRDMWFDILKSKPGVGHTTDALADVRRIEQIWHEALAMSGGPFLFGAFTIADAMFAPVAARFRTYGVDVDATCRTYIDAIFALPAVQHWMRDAASEPETR